MRKTARFSSQRRDGYSTILNSEGSARRWSMAQTLRQDENGKWWRNYSGRVERPATKWQRGKGRKREECTESSLRGCDSFHVVREKCTARHPQIAGNVWNGCPCSSGTRLVGLCWVLAVRIRSVEIGNGEHGTPVKALSTRRSRIYGQHAVHRTWDVAILERKWNYGTLRLTVWTDVNGVSFSFLMA